MGCQMDAGHLEEDGKLGAERTIMSRGLLLRGSWGHRRGRPALLRGVS